MHTEEPVVSSRAGDAPLSTDGQPGTGHAPGQRSVQQANGLHLLGFEEEEEEAVLAGSAGKAASVLSRLYFMFSVFSYIFKRNASYVHG